MCGAPRTATPLPLHRCLWEFRLDPQELLETTQDLGLRKPALDPEEEKFSAGLTGPHLVLRL